VVDARFEAQSFANHMRGGKAAESRPQKVKRSIIQMQTDTQPMVPPAESMRLPHHRASVMNYDRSVAVFLFAAGFVAKEQ